MKCYWLSNGPFTYLEILVCLWQFSGQLRPSTTWELCAPRVISHLMQWEHSHPHFYISSGVYESMNMKLYGFDFLHFYSVYLILYPFQFKTSTSCLFDSVEPHRMVYLGKVHSVIMPYTFDYIQCCLEQSLFMKT